MRYVHVRLLYSLFFIATFWPLLAFGDPIDTLEPGHWYEVPNSRLSSFFPSPTPPGSTGPTAVMSAWSGGTYDTRRNHLIVHGGGHGDYAGNEIYAFDIATFKWSRLWGPTPNASIPSSTAAVTETCLDGSPRAVHTYGGLLYLPTDRLWRSGGSLWSGSGQGSRATWAFDFTASAWERKADSQWLGVSQASAYDPTTGHVFAFSDRGVIAEYDPTNDTWTKRVGLSGIRMGEEMMAAVDPAKRLFIAIGNGKSIVYDIKANTVRSQATTGPQNVMNARGPGLVYDPVLKKIVGWAGGTSVYSLDTSSWSWIEHPAATTNAVTPTSPTRAGVFGRFQYIPAKNAYILVNDTGQDVFFYRLASNISALLRAPTTLQIQ